MIYRTVSFVVVLVTFNDLYCWFHLLKNSVANISKIQHIRQMIIIAYRLEVMRKLLFLLSCSK